MIFNQLPPSIPEPKAPEVYFWYTISFLLTTALIWIITRYVSRSERREAKLDDAIAKITLLVELHEREINDIKGTLKDIKTKLGVL